MSFLPNKYEAPAGSSDFFKLDEGVNKVRIMSDALIGWEGWKNDKPFRREGIEKNIEDDEVDIDQKFTKKPKIDHIWAFTIWDYETSSVKVFTLKQKTIMKAIDSLVNDDDWGDPKNYDLGIEKTVNGSKTTYSVKPYPPKKLDKKILDAVKASTVDAQMVFGEEETPATKKKGSKDFENF